jgi:hypothetical protein
MQPARTEEACDSSTEAREFLLCRCPRIPGPTGGLISGGKADKNQEAHPRPASRRPSAALSSPESSSCSPERPPKYASCLPASKPAVVEPAASPFQACASRARITRRRRLRIGCGPYLSCGGDTNFFHVLRNFPIPGCFAQLPALVDAVRRAGIAGGAGVRRPARPVRAPRFRRRRQGNPGRAATARSSPRSTPASCPRS